MLNLMKFARICSRYFDICLITMVREKHKRLTHAPEWGGGVSAHLGTGRLEELAQDKADTKYM